MKASELITLKSLNIQQRLSEDSTCFSANIYVGKVKVGEATNHGHGGPNNYHFAKGKEQLFKDAVEKWVKANGETGVELDDAMLGQYIEEYEDKKIAKRFAKKGYPVTLKVWRGKDSCKGHDGSDVEWYGECFMVAIKDEADAKFAAERHKAEKWEIVRP